MTQPGIRMAEWDSIIAEYGSELREINWLNALAATSDDPHILASSDEPIILDYNFWSHRTHEIESHALKTLSSENIDRVFDDVAAVMDENLDRFNPIIEYFGHFYPDPVDASIRMDRETEMAHSVKRDLAWIAVERLVQRTSFFSSLLDWYTLGRWPCGWLGSYPDGHVLCL